MDNTQIKRIWITDKDVNIETVDLIFKSLPLAWFPRLKNASKDELESFTRSPVGIHWPALGQDLSFDGFFTFAKTDALENK